MNRRLAGDASLNTPIRQDSDAVEWQDWLLDDSPSQERVLVESEDFDNRRTALCEALKTLSSRERHIFEARRLADEPSSLNELAHEFGVSRERYVRSRCGPSKRCRMLSDIASPRWSGRKCWPLTKDGFPFRWLWELMGRCCLTAHSNAGSRTSLPSITSSPDGKSDAGAGWMAG
jgi:hypothetical protein